jgi:predicted GIY-YIG superfamily endonuclease
MAVYLIHFDSPISEKHTCQHYLGYAEDPAARLKEHKSGRGARLTQVANERSIGYSIVRVWPDGDRNFERQLKNRKNTPCLCPVCSGK